MRGQINISTLLLLAMLLGFAALSLVGCPI